MVHIIVENTQNRVIYTLSIVFETILGIPYQVFLLEKMPQDTNIFTLNYTQTSLIHALQIPNMGFLTEVDKHTSFFLDANKSFEENWLTSHIYSTHSTIFPFDIFSAVFYLVSDYEKYQSQHFDTHNRYDEKAYPSFAMQLFLQPTVHVLCEKLATFFPKSLQEKISLQKKYDYEITFDIDNPWKHKHKSLWIQVAGLLKDIFQRNKENIFERLAIIKGRKDVNDTFEEICSLCPPEKTHFFCLIDRHSGYDTRFTFRHKQMQELIRGLYKKGYKVGIHPSYTSFDSAQKIAFEAKQLSHIINVPITHSRQHFLRYRLPHTFRHLIQAGITDDYTLCLRNGIGFPCGMAVPFLWYDLEKEAISKLTLHPTLAMDRAMQQYMGLSPSEALAKMEELILLVKKIGGKMTVVFHNESLSESAEWKGWRKAIIAMIGLILKA